MSPTDKEGRRAITEQRRAAVRRMIQDREPAVVTPITEAEFRMFAWNAISQMIGTIEQIKENILYLEGQMVIVSQAANDGLRVEIYRHDQSDGSTQFELKVSQKSQIGFKTTK